MMLAGWPPGVVHGGPETRHSLGNGCKTHAACVFRKASGEVSRGPVEKQGSDEAGSAALPVVPVAKASDFDTPRPIEMSPQRQRSPL